MKILMISEKDAANVSLAKIADAFLRYGHYVEIYAPYYNEKVLRCFSEKVKKYPLEALTDEKINQFDAVFASSVSGVFVERKGILLNPKPIFTQNYLIDKQIVWGGDYCFVPSMGTVQTEYDSYFEFIKIAAGEPKYDSFRKNVVEKKQFLFIDSGHFPFGEYGKRELAKTLLSICHGFPEYRLVIKPRFLPGDTVRTHLNQLDLSQVLQQESGGCMPVNLCILSEHRDLQELIEESHTVICMYTTAFAGAVLAGKGLVILDYLPSEDTYDIRKKAFDRVREQMEGSGALVDYREAICCLPHGIKAEDTYKQFLFAEESDSSGKICREVERLAGIPIDWNQCILRRYRDYLVYKTFIHTDYRANARLDIGCAFQEITEFTDTYIRDNWRSRPDEFHERVAEFSLAVRNKSILANRQLLEADGIDIGIYLNALYLSRDFNGILNFPDYDLGSVWLFKGLAYFELGKWQGAEQSLLRFAEKTIGRDYIKEISDMSDNRRRGMETLASLLERSEDRESAHYYREG